jgi:hypothetical protein
MDNRETLDSMRSNEQIHTRDQLFSDGDQVAIGLNDKPTGSTEKSKKRKLDLKPVARVTRSKAKAKVSNTS